MKPAGQKNDELFVSYGDTFDWVPEEICNAPAAKPAEIDPDEANEPPQSPSIEGGFDLVELPEDSCLIYFTKDSPNWKLGKLSGVDEAAKLIEAHRYGSNVAPQLLNI